MCRNKDATYGRPNKVNTVGEDEGSSCSSEDDELQIYEVNILQHSDNPLCTITIYNIDIPMMADSGACYTLISDDFLTKFKNKTIIPPDIELVAYGNKPFKTLGYFHATLIYQGINITFKVYVTKGGSCLLGWPQQKDLQIILDPNPLIVFWEQRVEFVHYSLTLSGLNIFQMFLQPI